VEEEKGERKDSPEENEEEEDAEEIQLKEAAEKMAELERKMAKEKEVIRKKLEEAQAKKLARGKERKAAAAKKADPAGAEKRKAGGPVLEDAHATPKQKKRQATGTKSQPNSLKFFRQRGPLGSREEGRPQEGGLQKVGGGCGFEPMPSNLLGPGATDPAKPPAASNIEIFSFVDAASGAGIGATTSSASVKQPLQGKPMSLIVSGMAEKEEGAAEAVVSVTPNSNSVVYPFPSLSQHRPQPSKQQNYDDKYDGFNPSSITTTTLPRETYHAYMMSVGTPEDDKHPADLCVLDCRVAGVDTSALVDSGVQANIIGREVLRKLNTPLRMGKVNMRVVGEIAEHPLNIHGVTEINIGLRGYQDHSLQTVARFRSSAAR